MIVDDVIGAVEKGRSPIVLTERRDHLELLAAELSKAIKNVVVLQGGMSEKDRRSAVSRLETIPRDQERVILATGRFAGEGFDDPRLDTLFLVLPVSWKGTLIQYAGRLHRHLPEKTEVRIYDYVDSEVALLARMFERRVRGYRAMGYEVDGDGLPAVRNLPSTELQVRRPIHEAVP
jgi:superfamily II DNA or RNA helicase